MTGPGRLDIRQGDGFLYVAREIVVNLADLPLVAAQLDELGAVRQRVDRVLDAHIALFRLPNDEPDVPTVVTRLRTLPVEREPRVGPNHVLLATGPIAQPAYHAGPGGAPTPAPAPTAPKKTSNGDRVRIAILDTGVDPAALNLPLLNGRFDVSAREPDPVYILNSAPQIALTGGHGTMVAGIVARHAPNAVLLSFAVLNPDGVGTDLSVSAGIERAINARATVLNLSFGGYAMGNQPLTAMDALAPGLHNTISVVSAAGNYSSSQPFYPAAFNRVVGVAALDTTFPHKPLAGFSNYGSWVNACSAGVRIHSTYVTGTWSHLGHVRQLSGHAGWSGTSFATPHVAATIADGVQGGLTARQVEANLLTGTNLQNRGVEILPTGVLTY